MVLATAPVLANADVQSLENDTLNQLKTRLEIEQLVSPEKEQHISELLVNVREELTSREEEDKLYKAKKAFFARFGLMAFLTLGYHNVLPLGAWVCYECYPLLPPAFNYLMETHKDNAKDLT